MASKTQSGTAKNTAAKSAEAKPKRERKTLTHDERIAKIEAELEAAKAKAGAVKKRKLDQLNGEVAKLKEKRDALDSKIATVQAEIDTLAGPEGDKVEGQADEPNPAA